MLLLRSFNELRNLKVVVLLYKASVLNFICKKMGSLETAFVIVLMLLFSWWCEDDFTQCFHWALSTKKFDQQSSIYSLIHHPCTVGLFAKKSTKFINWLLASCFNEDNLVYCPKLYIPSTIHTEKELLRIAIWADRNGLVSERPKTSGSRWKF